MTDMSGVVSASANTRLDSENVAVGYESHHTHPNLALVPVMRCSHEKLVYHHPQALVLCLQAIKS